MSTLRVENLHASYGKSEALKGVSLELAPGEVVGLIGRNGAGKSTTIKAVMNIVESSPDSILRFGDQDLREVPTYEIAKLGISYVPEDRRVFTDLSVVENLQVAHRSGSRWSVERILAMFPSLDRRQSFKGGSLSGGEQQMLAIGRALMSDPKVILLDEPFEGLAPLIVRELIEVVKDISQGGVSVLLVEQNLAACLELASRQVIVENGMTVYQSTSEDLRGRQDVQEKYLGVKVKSTTEGAR